MPLLARFGVTATCRASFALYNTREEVDVLAEVPHQGSEVVRMSDDVKDEAAATPRRPPDRTLR